MCKNYKTYLLWYRSVYNSIMYNWDEQSLCFFVVRSYNQARAVVILILLVIRVSRSRLLSWSCCSYVFRVILTINSTNRLVFLME